MVDPGMGNTRMQVFFDVWLLLRDFAVDDALLVDAVRATFARRGTLLPDHVPIALTPAFAEDEAKRKQWRAFVWRAGLAAEGGGPELAEVTDSIASRTDPIFAAASEATADAGSDGRCRSEADAKQRANGLVRQDEANM